MPDHRVFCLIAIFSHSNSHILIRTSIFLAKSSSGFGDVHITLHDIINCNRYPPVILLYIIYNIIYTGLIQRGGGGGGTPGISPPPEQKFPPPPPL